LYYLGKINFNHNWIHHKEKANSNGDGNLGYTHPLKPDGKGRKCSSYKNSSTFLEHSIGHHQQLRFSLLPLFYPEPEELLLETLQDILLPLYQAQALLLPSCLARAATIPVLESHPKHVKIIFSWVGIPSFHSGIIGPPLLAIFLFYQVRLSLLNISPYHQWQGQESSLLQIC